MPKPSTMYRLGFIRGSRAGAQTPIEHRQNSRNYPEARQLKVHPDVTMALACLPDGAHYQVWHKWKKNVAGDVKWRFTVHHSQIFITTPDGEDVLNFGVLNHVDFNFSSKPGDYTMIRTKYACLKMDNGVYERNPYRVSESYHPNPVDITGLDIRLNLKQTLKMCGANYNLLLNNCQSFARIFMQSCGALHYRHPFHP